MYSRRNILHLYKKILRESQKFESYNFRNYALRLTKDSFRENKTLTDPDQVRKEVEYALKHLEIIKRQVAIGSMYNAGKLVIEK